MKTQRDRKQSITLVVFVLQAVSLPTARAFALRSRRCYCRRRDLVFILPFPTNVFFITIVIRVFRIVFYIIQPLVELEKSLGGLAPLRFRLAPKVRTIIFYL